MATQKNGSVSISETLVPAEPGLQIVHVPENLPLILVRRAFEQAVLTGGNAYGLCFQHIKQLVPFLPISRNQQEQANELYGHLSGEGKALKVLTLGKNQFDVFSNEGMQCVTMKMGKCPESVCTFQQQLRSPFKPSQVDSFITLRNRARDLKICIIVFLQTGQSPEAIGCTELADEYLLLSSCEPYIGSMTSFSVTPLSREWLRGTPTGNTYMSTIWEKEAGFDLQSESFVHEKLINRLSWISQQLLVGPEEAGKLLHVSRQTVWRQSTAIFVPSPHVLPTPDFVARQMNLIAGPNPDDDPLEY